MSEEVNFDCQPNNTQKAIRSVYGELLSSDDKLNRRPAYQRSLIWNDDQKSNLIDTIMTNCPMPIFLLYMFDEKEEYECIDGQNRLTTIKEYIEQDPRQKPPFSWRIEKEVGEEHVYFNKLETRELMQAYCDEQNKKRASKNKNNPKTYRLMTSIEVKRFEKYELTLSQIKTELSFNQRKQIFMRWQNGTSISQCDSYKNEDYPYCVYVVENSLDRNLAETVSGFLKSGRNNWLWDIYRLFNAYLKDELKEIILSSIAARVAIEKETSFNATNFKDAQSRLEKLLIKLKPLETMKTSMYLSFLLGFIYLWKKAIPQVRTIAEKEEVLLAFAKESFENETHYHSTLNNGPQAKEFIANFQLFEDLFFEIIDRFTPVQTTPQSTKRKETIPAPVKALIWEKYIGKEKGEGECYCCGRKNITMREFQAGHIIPEHHGGPPTVENLRPICSSCNQSMGTQNMHNFIKKYFPKSK